MDQENEPNKIANETVLNPDKLDLCLVQCDNGTFQACKIELLDNEMRLGKVDEHSNVIQTVLQFKIDSFQCLLVPSLRDRAGVIEDSLLFAQSSRCTRVANFDRQEDASRWHRQILRQQGFLDKRMEQYEFQKRVANGSFGQVEMYKHKYSGVKVAIKIMEKTFIEQTFDNLGEPFSE